MKKVAKKKKRAESFNAVMKAMTKTAEFNEKSWYELPDYCRVAGSYCGEPVVTRPSVARKLREFIKRAKAAHRRELKEAGKRGER